MVVIQKEYDKKERLRYQFGSDWAAFLGPFLHSEEFTRIGKKLLPYKHLITPALQDVFRCFRECNLYKLHSVIITMAPYPTRTVKGDLSADGLAFSARNNEEVPAQLDIIYKALDESVYQGDYNPDTMWNSALDLIGHDLTPWAQQGILLLNCSFTTQILHESDQTHIQLWRPFLEYIIRQLNEHKDALGFILMGSHAQSLQPLILNPTHQVFTCELPSAANYYKRSWYHRDCFKQLTAFQKVANNIQIQW